MVAPAVLTHVGLDAVLARDPETLIARLAQAAYQVALRHTPEQPFTDLELTLWRELRSVVLDSPPAERSA